MKWFLLLWVCVAAVPAAAQRKELEAQEQHDAAVKAAEVPPGARLDPVVAGKIQSAAVKYGWSGGAKWTATLAAATGVTLGIYALASDYYTREDIKPLLPIPFATAGAFALVAYFLDQSAAADLEEVGLAAAPPSQWKPSPP
jgi:hypothetical protein